MFKLIGYWYSDFKENKNYPKAHEFISPDFWVNIDKLISKKSYEKYDKPLTKQSVVNYLKNGKVCASYRGCSNCRICQQDMGYRELTDFCYIWPEGLYHYIEAHDVMLPISFCYHVFKHRDFGYCHVDKSDESYWQDEMSHQKWTEFLKTVKFEKET